MNDEIINLKVHELKNDLCISSNIRMDLDYILKELNIKKRRENLGKGVLGACKTDGLNKLIAISNEISYIGQERFTEAHELGHIVLHHNKSICKKEDFSLWRFTKGKEYEANQFAVELLMPKLEIQEILYKKDISFNVIREISGFYETSLTSTAIRCTKLYNDSSILILHKNQKILWEIKSNECEYKLSSKIVDIGTLSSNLNNKTFVEGFVESSLWIDIEDSDSVQCYEETMYSKNIGTYLTILKFIENE